jgi:16S rRNA (cytidine1402-2'-O)-methyltransferase
VSDPGQLLVRYCIDNEIEFDILPGANALLTAFVASGFVETKMLFFGFLDHKGASRAAGLQQALHSGYTTILYESPHRLDKLLLEIESEEPKREIFLAKELTKKYQNYFHGTAREIYDTLAGNYRGEWVVVISASEAQNSSAISQKDILELDLPKKVQAKLISKITGENTKVCYQRLLDN